MLSVERDTIETDIVRFYLQPNSVNKNMNF